MTHEPNSIFLDECIVCVVVSDIADIAKAMNDAKTSWMVQKDINT
jgi:hypothetical protein